MQASSSRALILTRSRSPNPSPSILPRPSTPALVGSPAVVQEWQPILHASNQVVLYNPRSHALSITSAPANITPAVVLASSQRRAAITAGGTAIIEPCPYCKQALPQGFHDAHAAPRLDDHDVDEEARWEDLDQNVVIDENDFEAHDTDPAYHYRASDYFQLLAIANDATSQASTSGSASPSSGYREHLGTRSRTSRSRGRSQARARTPDQYQSRKGTFPADKMAEGYFQTFFQEEYKLGMGANGSVFLCKHVLDGNALGHFAIKKIAVGESHSYLLKTLREVRLLERLRHPNIITYHHAWLENAQFSSFGPTVPTLHVLMQWAEGGSLDDFIDVRLGLKPAHIHMRPPMSPLSASEPGSPTSSTNELPLERDPEPEQDEPMTPTPTAATIATTSEKPDGDPHSKSARIRAFKAVQRAPLEDRERMRRELGSVLGGMGVGPTSPTVGNGSRPGNSAMNGIKQTEWTPVHLLSADEVKSLFQDVVEGLAFLHSKSILHLDLKPGNVLLTWDEGRLIPRAMLSDFGTSRDMINSSLQRSGNTGTLEYTAPESLPSPQTGLLLQIDSKADMWSLGMILHKMLFFRLPYRYAAAGDANGEPVSRNEEGEKMDQLENEVLTYPGFKSTPAHVAGFEARRLPRAFLVLLEGLLHKMPSARPSCERVANALREGKLDPLPDIPIAELPLSRPQRTLSGSENVTPSPSSKHSPEVPTANEKPLLALPSPPEVLGSEDTARRSRSSTRNIGRWLHGDDVSRTERHRRLRSTGIRFMRSSLLVAKALSIPRMCGADSTRPRPVVAVVLLGMAIADTVLDHRDWNEESDEIKPPSSGQVASTRPKIAGIWFTLGLTAIHFGFLALISSSDVLHKYGVTGSWLEKICCVPVNASNTSFFETMD
ncbi:kinase-like domain-containing protein [Crepidotus variabilis]|uniref:non-specific serine/threonine protein kinase n=1 Tax=Crepidotus variabilis TaxID=179855 RepID=A0A9P6EAP5_9AGAR|nr:kinase-like domain-containing protein [Crepidotus variabilis]